MGSSLTPLDGFVLVAHAAGRIAVGWHVSRRTRTSDDYLLGGRRER